MENPLSNGLLKNSDISRILSKSPLNRKSSSQIRANMENKMAYLRWETRSNSMRCFCKNCNLFWCWYITDIFNFFPIRSSNGQGSIKDKWTCDLWGRTVTTVYLLLISKLYLIQGENEAHVISTLKIHWAVLNLKCRFNLASDNLPFMEIPVIWNILGNHDIITVMSHAFPLVRTNRHVFSFSFTSDPI